MVRLGVAVVSGWCGGSEPGDAQSDARRGRGLGLSQQQAAPPAWPGKGDGHGSTRSLARNEPESHATSLNSLGKLACAVIHWKTDLQRFLGRRAKGATFARLSPSLPPA